ncbi:Spherulin-1A [Cyphellophora attinorum]|uniref:Spherulin-1A n=1 Tax=Cyphellophora attinorum TaxID=1664694 RepID=A0A0N1H4U9_9EURO|nr:Spherulin-1A [Phialophora attinorum]KPI37195.1 Spherulin-1A [Phialophora attinorum]
MHASILIATLAASMVSATPLMARQQQPSQPAFAPAPSAGSPPPPPPTTTSITSPPVTTGQLGKPGTPNKVPPKGLVGELLTEDTTVTRFKDIKAQIDAGAISLKFDHNPAANPNVTAGMGGQVDLANRANFPVLTGLGISSATIFFQPCGLNTPHVHPRATEYFTLATDTKMSTGFVLENGLTEEFKTNLTIWQGTVFPQGSIHWQQNDDCKPAVGVAGLNSEDPGASSIAQNFLRFTSADVVDAALGFPAEINGENFAQFAAALPASLSKGVKECLVRCNIPH